MGKWWNSRIKWTRKTRIYRLCSEEKSGTKDWVYNSAFGVEYPGLSGGTLSANNIVKCYARSYHGVIDGSTIDEVNIPNLNNVLSTSKSRTLTFNMTKQRCVYMYPKSLGALTTIKDSNNFEYINSYTRTTITYNEVEYYVYILTDPVTITNFKQIFN